MDAVCPNCSTSLVGEYCHGCGQRRLSGRLSLEVFLGDVARRVFRFDGALVGTFTRMLRAPAKTVVDYLEGRRHQLLDPIQYFVSSVFVQFAAAAATRSVAPLVHRESALSWLQQLGGAVAAKILIVFWVGSVWRLLFRARVYNLAEIYVFSAYVFGTTGILMALTPLVDLLVPLELGGSSRLVLVTTLVLDIVYGTYAVRKFAGLTWWTSALRVMAVVTVGYGVLVGLFEVAGIESAFGAFFHSDA